MTTLPDPSRRRVGFTLIEMLVTISILVLLIAILLPSLTHAKDVARKAKTAAELATISTNLELFQTDFRQYPESNATRVDPITNLPSVVYPGEPKLQGAHWLARALAGPDGEGVDGEGLVLRDRQYVSVGDSGQLISTDSGGLGGTIASLQRTSRKSRYLGSTKLLALDSDSSRFARPFDGRDLTKKGRFVLADAFDGPILYYRATPKAGFPFTTNESGAGYTEGPAVYNMHDNAAITGCNTTGGGGWDFSNTSMLHGLGYFGPSRSDILANPNSVHTTVPPASDHYRGRSFCDLLHDHQTHEAGGIIKPLNADAFLLISAGKDALFGTDDDVANFQRR